MHADGVGVSFFSHLDFRSSVFKSDYLEEDFLGIIIKKFDYSVLKSLFALLIGVEGLFKLLADFGLVVGDGFAGVVAGGGLDAATAFELVWGL